MKVTNFGPGGLPKNWQNLGGGITSVNSNFNTTDGGLTAVNFVQRITANSSNVLLNPIVNFASGSNIILTLDQGPLPAQAYPSNTIRIHSTAGGAGGLISSNGSNTLSAVINLQAGSGIALGVSGQTITITNTGSGGGGGGSSSSDAVQDVFGTPDTAYEFSTSSLSGLTALGSPTAEDANTTIPGCYYVQKTGATYAWVGRYATPPSAPWTAITWVRSGNPFADFNVAALFLGVASPGNMDALEWGRATRRIDGERVTPSAFSSSFLAPGTDSTARTEGIFLALKVNSSTSVDYLTSYDGRVWNLQTAARNPGITIGSVGIAVKSENATYNMTAAFEFLRIWNSAKTFPGA